MRLFTILGVVFLVVGVGLAVVSMLPGSGGFWDEFRNQGAGIAAVTLIPMGIIFTVIGVWFGRLTAGRKRLLREGVPGQATILSLEGGNMVVNNINYLMTFQLLVHLPGRQPYQVEHKQLVPIFSIASLPIGGTVPVMIDPQDPRKLTIDLAGEAAAMRQAASIVAPATGAQVVPNTLSTMRGASPNIFTPEGPVMDQLQRAGIAIDPAMLTQGVVTVSPAATVDASPTGQSAQAMLLANGRPGTAFIRESNDTGIDVHGDSVVELTLDVTPQGGGAYEVRTAALVPAAARARALPGTSVPVRIDPLQTGSVAIDWLR